MDMTPILITDEWADWPKPSPTSTRNLNVRFYSVVDEEEGSSLRMDIGRETEQLLETLYEALGLDKHITPADFESYIRRVYQTRLDASASYTTFLARYTILTADAQETTRALSRERDNMLRSIRLLPYRITDKLVDRPTDFWGKVRYRLQYLGLRLRLLFPLR